MKVVHSFGMEARMTMWKSASVIAPPWVLYQFQAVLSALTCSSRSAPSVWQMECNFASALIFPMSEMASCMFVRDFQASAVVLSVFMPCLMGFFILRTTIPFAYALRCFYSSGEGVSEPQYAVASGATCPGEILAGLVMVPFR